MSSEGKIKNLSLTNKNFYGGRYYDEQENTEGNL